MVTRFSAAEARQNVELAKMQAELEKHAAEDRKRQEDALREKQARLQAAIDEGWEAQKTLLIDAAVDGKKELILEPPIYKFQSFIDVGIDFIEVGWVKNQEIDKDDDLYANKDYERRDEKILSLEEGIRVLTRDLIVAAESDWKKYYGSIEKYVTSIDSAVSEAIDSTSGVFDGDYVLWVDVPTRLRQKYSSHFLHITNAIKFLKKSRQNPLYGLPSRKKKKREEMLRGEYHFSNRDQKVDVLGEPEEPTEDGDDWLDEDKNHYKVQWTSDEIPEFMSEPLFSRTGLNWISDEHGQKLLEAVFDSLKGAAVKGRDAASLKFKLTSHGWYFVNDAGHHYQSCMPNDLVEIIARQDFTVVDTTSSANSYAINLRW